MDLPNVFVDQSFCMSNLLHSLDKVEVHDHLFKSIIQWALLTKEINDNFFLRTTTQVALLNDLQNQFHLKKLVSSCEVSIA